MSPEPLSAIVARSHHYYTVPRSFFGLSDISVGPDKFTHCLLGSIGLKKGNGRLNLEDNLILPLVNVDSTVGAKEYTCVRSGLYLLVAAYHRYKTPGAYPAFFITRAPDPVTLPNGLDAWHASTLRRGLPTTSGVTTDYINFHRASAGSDGSLGCFTCPREHFDGWRAMYSDNEVSLLRHWNTQREVDLNLIASSMSRRIM